MSGGLKIRRGWRATNSSDHLLCVIDVTAAFLSSKQRAPGRNRHGAPFFESSRGVRVMHTAVRRQRFEVQVLAGAPLHAAIVQQQDTALPRLRCRCDSGWPHQFGMPTTRRPVRMIRPRPMPPWPTQQGACLVNRSMWVRIPPEAPFQYSLHGVTAAFLVVNETVPGRNRLREPISSIARKAKKPSQWFASPPYPVRVRGARPFHQSGAIGPIAFSMLPRCTCRARCCAKTEAEVQRLAR